jgi:hypothetical protein
MPVIRDFGQPFQTKIYWQSEMADKNREWLTFLSTIFE